MYVKSFQTAFLYRGQAVGEQICASRECTLAAFPSQYDSSLNQWATRDQQTYGEANHMKEKEHNEEMEPEVSQIRTAAINLN